MPCRAIVHTQRSAEATVTAYNTGQSTFNFPNASPSQHELQPVASDALACYRTYRVIHIA
eukprot:6183687-Pleurochrysis_carterae.AAC.1